MHREAELWAAARRAGLPTTSPAALDSAATDQDRAPIRQAIADVQEFIDQAGA
jgi:hypothetical protein